jgi:hypothetical protein
MRRLLGVGAFASLCLAGLATPLAARAMLIRPPAGPGKLVQADTVVVGKVMGLEDQDVSATAPFPGATNKVSYRIAVVKVSDAIRGAKGKGTIRVGFIAPAPAPVVPPGGGIRPFIRRPLGVNLSPGQDGLFYLAKHPTESFYTLPAYYSFTSSQTPAFAEEVKTARKAAKLLDDPVAGLKSTDAQDRLLTAGLLLGQYRTARGFPPKTEPVGAEESKLILSAILSADWNRPVRFGDMNPQQLFFQLGLTPKDGWQQRPFPNIQDQYNAMREWLREHRDTYRIQRFVAANQGASR